MLTKRIIPCLDIDKERVVKGIEFLNLQDAGDPVVLGKYYTHEGADELVFLDITASTENRKPNISFIKKVAKEIHIPFTVGGGIKNLNDAKAVLRAGADKISLNTAAVRNPKIISSLANIFGSQCIVVALDAKKSEKGWKVFINGGRTETKLDALEWAKQAVMYGAGEILLTSIDSDGTKKGFNIELTKLISENVSVPIIASGGAGSKEDFFDVFIKGNADGALAASLFHFKELFIANLKKYLSGKDIPIRKI